MPRTRTTFQPGHKGMGGRPKGSRNRAKEDWRVAQRRAEEIGRTCDALLDELTKSERQGGMSAREAARLLKLITTRQKSLLARSQYVRPVVRAQGFRRIHRPLRTAPGEDRGPQQGGAPQTVTTSEADKKASRNGISVPGTATTAHKGRQTVEADPEKRKAKPDAGARKAAKKLRELEAVAKQFAPAALEPGRIAAMSSKELLAALDALVPVETFHLSRSMDPRPIVVGKPFTYVSLIWPPGVDPSEQDPNWLSSRQSSEDPPLPAALPQPPPGLASGAMEVERAIRAPR